VKSNFFLILFLTFSYVPFGWSYFSTADTGDILSNGHYRASLEAQDQFGNMTGANVIGRFDAGLSSSSNIRVLLGTGSVNLQWGLYYKWVPIPDYQDQPAIGIMAGVLYGYENDNMLSFRAHPLISKKFTTDVGEFTPFASLPFGTTTASGVTTYPLQLALGSEWKPQGLERFSFMLETGVNIINAFHYVSAVAILHFDEEHGIQFK
jgi:hypothetical protein